MKSRYQKIIVISLLALIVFAPQASALTTSFLSSVPTTVLKDPIEEIARRALELSISKLLENPDYLCEGESYKQQASRAGRITVLKIDVEACKKLLDAIGRLPMPEVSDAIHQDNIEKMFKDRILKLANQVGTLLSGLQLELFKAEFNFAFDKACVDVSKFAAIQDKLKKATNALSLIGDNSGLVVQLKAQDEEVQNQALCRETFLKVLDNTFPQPPSSSLFTVNNEQSQTYKTEKLRVTNQLQSQIDTLNQIHTQLAEQIRIASRSVWKAIFVKVLLNLADTKSQRLVNSMLAKFKVNKTLGYVNALASQVYAIDAIRDGGYSNSDQLILYSMLKNPLFQQYGGSNINPVFTAKAEQFLTSDKTTGLSYLDPQYYQKLNDNGSCEGSPFCQSLIYDEKLNNIKQTSTQTAVNETNLGGGIKTPYDCSKSLQTDQAKVDAGYAAAVKEADDRKKLANSIPRDDPNYAQAQQDYVTAKDAVNNYNKKYSDPVALVCKAAITPAKFVGDSITQLIGSHIKNITDYNNNNLPYYQTAIAGILTSLVDKYLFGGSNVNNQTLINEAAGIGLSAINNGNGRSASSVLIQGTDFYFKQLAVGQYQVYWDYNTAAIKSAGGSYVTIDGPGIQNKKARYGLTDSVVVDISQDELYTTHIFNASGKEILTDQVFVTNVGPVLGNPSGGSGGGNASISKPGTVAGVSVTSVFPRGQPLQLRGN